MAKRTKLTVIDGGKARRMSRKRRKAKAESETAESVNTDQPIETKKKRDVLTPKQEAFCKALLKGAGSYSEAYRAAYNAENMTAKSIHENASRMMTNSKVQARLDAGFKAQDDRALHTGQSLRLKIEADLLETAKATTNEAIKIRCLELLGKSQKVGYFLDRTTEIEDELTPDQVSEELEARLKKAFNE